MREYIVTKDILNIRSSASDENDDNFIGQLTAGETLYLTDDEIIGVTPKGGATNVWRSDNLNRVVSQDGVRLKNFADKKMEFINDPFNQPFIDPSDPTNQAKWKVNWGVVDMEIWKIWRDYNTKGEGVKVGVIDTGVHSASNDLNGKIKSTFSYATDSGGNPDNTMEDLQPYHGTKSAGVIGASGLFAKTVFGVAPGCDINIYKATNGGFDSEQVILAIKQAIEDGVKVISMSFSCQDDPTLAGWIDYAQTQNVIIIAGAGDSGTNQKCFPASYPGCLSIAAYCLDNNGDRAVFATSSNFNDAITFIGPGKDILTTSATSLPTLHQATSASTAFLAGVFALIISKVPALNYKQLIDILGNNSIAELIGNTVGRSDNEGYGILNLKILLELLTSKP